jgi:prophage DNA circulation protein
MATWLAKVREPSFRGESLGAVTSLRSVPTPRIVRHEYPGVLGGWTEHLEAGLRAWELTCVLSGADYVDRALMLQAALNVPEPGLLVHPTQGEILCSVDSCPWEESAGSAVFLIMFVESGRQADAPAARTSRRIALLSSVEAVVSGASEAFTGTFAGHGLPAWASAATIADATAQLAGIREAVEGPIGATVDGAAGLVADIRALESAVAALVATPDILAARISEVVRQIGSLQMCQLLTDRAGLPDSTGLTPDARAVAMNSIEMTRLIVRVALAAWGATILSEEWTAYDDAENQGAMVVARCTAEAEHAGGAAYDALVDLRAQVSAHLASVALRLPHLETISVVESSTLEIAWRYHADGARADEVRDRNGILEGDYVLGDVLVLVT